MAVEADYKIWIKKVNEYDNFCKPSAIKNYDFTPAGQEALKVMSFDEVISKKYDNVFYTLTITYAHSKLTSKEIKELQDKFKRVPAKDLEEKIEEEVERQHPKRQKDKKYQPREQRGPYKRRK